MHRARCKYAYRYIYAQRCKYAQDATICKEVRCKYANIGASMHKGTSMISNNDVVSLVM